MVPFGKSLAVSSARPVRATAGPARQSAGVLAIGPPRAQFSESPGYRRVCILRALTRWPPEPDDLPKSRDIPRSAGDEPKGQPPHFVGGAPKFRATLALPDGLKLIRLVCRRTSPGGQERYKMPPRMGTRTLSELQSVGASMSPRIRSRTLRSIFASVPVGDGAAWMSNALAPFVFVFLAYVVAGILGQTTSNIRSSNLGPVWPAYGIALAAGLKYGYRVWPALVASAFLGAVQGSVSATAAAGPAISATLRALTGTFLLRRIGNFDPSLSRLRDAIGLIVLGAFGSALVSSVIGVFSLYATGIQPYSGLPSAWLIYW